MLYFFAAVVGLGLGCAWTYYIFHKDADNDVGTLKPSDPTALGFLALYSLSSYLAYELGYKDPLSFSYACLYLSMLVSIAYVDIKTGYLYDYMLGFYAISLGVLSYFRDFELLKAGLMSMLIVFLFYGLIYLLARLYYKREAFGTGDIFFVSVVTMNMKPLQAIVLAFMAFYIAALYLLVKFLFKRSSGLNAEIAFCPYIALAALIVFLFEARVGEILALLLE